MRYKLSDVVDQISERENNPSSSQYEKFVGLEHYVSGDVVIKNYGSTEKLDSAMKVFHSGDILVARRNVYLRRAGVAFFDGLTSGDSIVLRPKEEVIGRLLPFVLNTDDFWDFADQHSDGTMSKRLSPKVLMQYEFDLPEEQEQEKLATLLWSAADTKTKYEELYEQTDELVKAKFLEMFGDPMDNSKSWPVCKVQDVMRGKVSNGFFAKPADYSDSGNAAIICVGDVVNRKYSKTEGLRRANASDKDFEKFKVEYGDALFCRSSLVKEGIGKTSIVPKDVSEDVLFECHVIRVPLNVDQIIPEFFQAFSVTDYFRNQMINRSKTATMTTIGQKDIITADIYLPPIEEQRKFVHFAEQSDRAQQQLLLAIEDVQALIRAIIQQDFKE